MNTLKNNLYLVGMMGAGKTSVGKQLARRLSRRFVDTDHEIEASTGVKIPTIFELEGETGFRQRESAILQALAHEADMVIATGGGIVLKTENRRQIAGSGTVIYLRVTPKVLFERTRHDRNRPLLQVEDPLARLEEIYALRDPLYMEIADIVIDGGNGSVQALTKRVEQELQKR